MDKIDDLLRFLASNEQWCTLNEISTSINVPAKACSEIVQFLSNYNFVKINGSSVIISSNAKSLFKDSIAETLLINQ